MTPFGHNISRGKVLGILTQAAVDKKKHIPSLFLPLPWPALIFGFFLCLSGAFSAVPTWLPGVVAFHWTE